MRGPSLWEITDHTWLTVVYFQLSRARYIWRMPCVGHVHVNRITRWEGERKQGGAMCNSIGAGKEYTWYRLRNSKNRAASRVGMSRERSTQPFLQIARIASTKIRIYSSNMLNQHAHQRYLLSRTSLIIFGQQWWIPLFSTASGQFERPIWDVIACTQRNPIASCDIIGRLMANIVEYL